MFPAAASRAVEKCASLLLASWMTGWRDPGRAEAEKERQEESGREQKRKGGKKGESGEGGGDRPSIILQSGQDGRDSKLPVSRLRSARAQPTSDDKTGSATLQRDVLCCDLTVRFSRAFGCAIILHPARINQR